MTWLNALARPSIVKLQAYQSARSMVTDARYFLDANETPGPAPQDLNRYPVPQPQELVNAFARLYSVDPTQVLIGRGSDEAIDILTRAFCEPSQDAILITPPTYGMYEVSAAIQNAQVVRVPLVNEGDDWKLDLKQMIKSLDAAKVKLTYICSPNNPTGTAFSTADIRILCEQAKNSLVVVDEAYVEFAPETSAVALLKEYKNLVVLRTLSKAWGLAGLRCGVALGDPELIQLLQKVRAPYPLPRPVTTMALQELNNPDKMLKRVELLNQERQRITQALRELPIVKTIFKSQANFLLIRFESEAAVMSTTRQAGMILRSRHKEPGLENCVRITIGSEEENDLLLKTLSEVKIR